jgi:hypothetical protein
MGFADSSKGNFKKGENRDTLHSFSIEYVRTLAEVFGWKVRTSKGSERGPDLVIEDVTDGMVKAVMFVESEVGHDQGGGGEYFDKLVKRLQPYLEEYRERKVRLFSLVVITNAPKRLAEYVREHRARALWEAGFPDSRGPHALHSPRAVGQRGHAGNICEGLWVLSAYTLLRSPRSNLTKYNSRSFAGSSGSFIGLLAITVFTVLKFSFRHLGLYACSLSRRPSPRSMPCQPSPRASKAWTHPQNHNRGT